MTGFVGFFATTVVLLGLVVWTGKRASMRAHIPLVIATVSALAITIYFAVRLGHHYDLPTAGWIFPVHMWVARIATASYLLPIATGIITYRKREFRKIHAPVAFLTVALTVAAAGTGITMILLADQIP